MVKVKILIVDDEVDYCMIMQNYFEEKGYDVYIAFNLAEGLRLLDVLNPELLFLDNNLPDGEGWSKVSEIVENHPEMKIHLISAYGVMPELIKKSPNLRFWEKPISMTELDVEF